MDDRAACSGVTARRVTGGSALRSEVRRSATHGQDSSRRAVLRVLSVPFASLRGSHFSRHPMSAYSIALFLHLVAGIALEQTGLRRLRTSLSLVQVREWVTLLRGVRRIDAPAGLTILLSGGYLAEHGAGHHAWVAAGIIGMVVMAVLGVAVGRPRFLPIVTALHAQDGPVTPSLRRR